MAAYAEALFLEYDATVFSWEGFHQDPNIWNASSVVGIDAFAVADTGNVAKQ